MRFLYFETVILHLLMTAAIGNVEKNATGVPQKALFLIALIEKPSYKENRVYLGYANDPFGNSQLASLKISNITAMFPTLSTESTNHVDSKENEVNSEAEQSLKDVRPKRGVFHLFNMISCATGCNPFIYKGYGCYCGFLGSGYVVDDIDRCCQIHDWCYNAANCPMWSEYFIPYFWICYRNKPSCAIHHGKWGGPGSCAYRLCECDRKLSECLSRYACPSSRAVCTSSPVRLLQNALMLLYN